MKRALLLVSLCVFLITDFACSQDILFDKSICWEITGPNTTKPSYVFGSVHMFDTCAVKFPVNVLKQMVDKCGSYCNEAKSIAVSKDSSVLKEFAKRSVLSDNKKNITNSLDKDYYDKLIQIIDSSRSELNLKMLKRALPILNPSTMAMMVSVEKQFSGSSLYKSSNFKMDSYYEGYAVKNGYETYELESGKEQMGMLFDCTFEESIESLKYCIDDFYSKDSTDMIKKYINQELDILKPEMYTNSLMIKRNTKMANGIDAIMQKHPVFVIIGAAHLPYENGVLNLLTKKGYTVKPFLIKFN